ncbi:MAG: SpoIIE family protein phosphatase [Deltaproteobacteria bacterium]|nr:SpoIIE family protein phosphatase [Deltaproteobacteria bacterium]
MSRSRVLVVEDHPLSRRILETMLTKSYEVISAASGGEAIDKAKHEPPDLVLLDIEMPGLNGFETFEILKSGIIEPAVPVIFLTALEDSKSRETGLEAGAVDYITKPYDKQELRIKVKNHLALYEARKVIESRNRVMAREMEMASQLQRSLLPEDFPECEHLVFSALYKPVSPAGGDFYDVIELGGSRIGFAEVDVSGHGVASAMVGAMFKMAFQSFARTTDSPAELLKVINDQMFGILPESDFLTVFYGIIDLGTLEMIYTNAGHPRPFLLKRNLGEIRELGVGGPLVGALSGMDYEEGFEQLQEGDQIFVYTDGVTETASGSDNGALEDFYGVERLKQTLMNNSNLAPHGILPVLLDDLEKFHSSKSFDDDITMFLAAVV